MKNFKYFVARFPVAEASWRFEAACAYEATRTCATLGECGSLLPRLIADAYLMGGEL